MTRALFDYPEPSAPPPVPEVRLWLDCVPPTANHQRKRIVRIGKFSRLADKPELVAAKDMLAALLLPHQVATPVPGPVSLELEFVWPWRASETKRNRALGRMRHTVRPDVDNAAKTFTDRLVALRFIEDDGQIADLHVSKWWGDRPGIAVVIRTIQ